MTTEEKLRNQGLTQRVVCTARYLGYKLILHLFYDLWIAIILRPPRFLVEFYFLEQPAVGVRSPHEQLAFWGHSATMKLTCTNIPYWVLRQDLDMARFIPDHKVTQAQLSAEVKSPGEEKPVFGESHGMHPATGNRINLDLKEGTSDQVRNMVRLIIFWISMTQLAKAILAPTVHDHFMIQSHIVMSSTHYLLELGIQWLRLLNKCIS